MRQGRSCRGGSARRSSPCGSRCTRCCARATGPSLGAVARCAEIAVNVQGAGFGHDAIIFRVLGSPCLGVCFRLRIRRVADVRAVAVSVVAGVSPASSWAARTGQRISRPLRGRRGCLYRGQRVHDARGGHFVVVSSLETVIPAPLGRIAARFLRILPAGSSSPPRRCRRRRAAGCRRRSAGRSSRHRSRR